MAAPRAAWRRPAPRHCAGARGRPSIQSHTRHAQPRRRRRSSASAAPPRRPAPRGRPAPSASRRRPGGASTTPAPAPGTRGGNTSCLRPSRLNATGEHANSRHADQAARAPPMSPSHQPQQRQRQRRPPDGEQPERGIAGAEHADPEVEQQVVERRARVRQEDRPNDPAGAGRSRVLLGIAAKLLRRLAPRAAGRSRRAPGRHPSPGARGCARSPWRARRSRRPRVRGAMAAWIRSPVATSVSSTTTSAGQGARGRLTRRPEAG